MTDSELKQKVLENTWQRWLERPFGAFFMSFFKEGLSRRVMRQTGVDAEYPMYVFERSAWYISHEVANEFNEQLKTYLKNGGSIFAVTEQCLRHYEEHKQKIGELITSDIDVTEKAKIIKDILSLTTSYIWLAHGFEDIYNEILQREVPKYVSGDIDKFIGDMSFPVKKNAHALMEEALARGDDLELVQKEFGWIKSRDGFADGFTVEEMGELREQMKDKKIEDTKIKDSIQIPSELSELAREVQELVYFRTLRTDVLYELLYLSRPILTELAARYALAFKDLRDYSIHDLIGGTPKKYQREIACACYRGEYLAFFDEPIIPVEQDSSQVVKGMVAFKGKVQGIAKIVKTVEELDKVKDGDILVTQMTFPSFIMAMKRAAGFVTDEGGITCHAAIVAREMKKPCIIGTKNATMVLKDGDRVEVDSVTGQVIVLPVIN